MIREILHFQNELLLPTLGESPRKLLKQKSWMGFKGSGISWSDLSEEDSNELARWLGPSAFKVIRFSPDIMQTIRSSQRKVVAGGSCLITTADNKQIKKGSRIEDLIPHLPNLAQLVDPMLPIRGASLHLNILEDSLFAEQRAHILGALQAQGCRHTTMFATWARMHEAMAPVQPCFFSCFPVVEETEAFLRNPFFGRQMPMGISRAQVEFSFTGVWADMLRRHRATPQDCLYLVVEPFHHFTETMNVKIGTFGSPVSRLLHGVKRFHETYGYGEGLNKGIAGAIAFIPYVQCDGRLGYSTTISDATCHQDNVLTFLESRKRILSCSRIPSLSSDELFADGLNCLYLFPECRRALFEIKALWDRINDACTVPSDLQGRAYKKQIKAQKSRMRASDAVMQEWLASHKVLYKYLEYILLGVFNPLSPVVQLAS